ncbi:hypothetical protein B0T11DRAFT_29120 [Plectosphaerella cucumerina]|uniref:Uncharacterized protein n=1 Tax=Plectosphaerella cucumerina TaxID=40658 RepID=A0A8K0X9N7_9PEZI|nr:hypothetical protein B0T11DRAFT_29120 [Plectosphaerella cucumerina]
MWVTVYPLSRYQCLQSVSTIHHLHGVMAPDDHSLDAVVYSQGDPISILEDELTGGSHHAMRVLGLSSLRPMGVLSSSVCWLPADGSTPLSWVAMSPAGNLPEVDVLPEKNLAWGLSSPSVASPLTPLANIKPVDSLRRDSAISFSRNDEIDDATGSNNQTIQPANSSRLVTAHTYEPLGHGATVDKLDLAGPPHGSFHPLFNNDYAPWKSYPQEAKTSLLINPNSSDSLNYMRMQTSYDCSPEAPHHERRAAPTQVAQTSTRPTAMSGDDWQGQIAHSYPDTVPATQLPKLDIHRFHDSVSSPLDPTQHYQMMSSLRSYDMSRAHGGQSQAPSSQGAVLQNHQPTFYRAAEQRTMVLTDVNYHGAYTRLISTPKPSKPRNSRNNRRPEPEPKPIPEEQALRPHVVLDYFRREVKPDVDALEARQREQGNYLTDEARARLVLEGLELVRPAVKNVTRALEALPPQNSQPWGGTQKRLQSDAEQILSMIQIIRRSALEEAEVRQHEPRPSPDRDAKPRKGLSGLVRDYVDKAEYVGKVTGHGARKENTVASHHAAATNGRPQAVAYPAAGLVPIAWTRGQTTTPPPGQRSSAMEHYHHHHHHHHHHHQHHMQHGLTASPAACTAMSDFGLHDPHPPIPTASARIIADTAMVTTMAPSGGPVGPEGWIGHHSPVSVAGLDPVQPTLGYAMPATNANKCPSPPGHEASSGQQHQLHHPYAGVVPSPFPGQPQKAMPPGNDMTGGCRGSLPGRRLMARERAAPYSLAYRMPSERKGSV